MGFDDLERFWELHGWLAVRSPATGEQQEWCQSQFDYCHVNRRGDHSVMLFKEEEHRTRFLLVWGTGDSNTTPWHPV
jgi:hypothetical protein